MNFLFLTDEYHPNFGANSLIVRTISKELVARGHKVWVTPAAYDQSLAQAEEFEGSTVIRELPNDDKVSLFTALKQFRFVKATKILAMILGARLMGTHRLWPKQKVAARDYLVSFISEHQIDVAVSIHCSVELSFPLLYLRKKNKLPCKWIWYMLDPFESHEYYRTYTKETKLKKIQHSMMKYCDRVIATDLIYADTAKWEEPAILEKIDVAGFPKIEGPIFCPAADDIDLPETGIHVVCTGSKNEAVRSSAYTMALCKKIPEVTFHFIGIGWAEDEIKYEDNLIFYPPHSYQSVRNVQQKADFLLNIGNAVANQLPSKVLEYISTGKPIINVYKTEQCPAKALLTNWDALNVFENEEAAGQLHTFLMGAHKDASFDEIKSKFKEYTPACVADKFLK